MKLLRTFLFAVFALISMGIQAQTPGYHIEIACPSCHQDTIFLGNHYGNNQYYRDTAYLIQDTFYVFEGNKPLEPGVYLLIIPPNPPRIIQFIVNENEQEFALLLTQDSFPAIEEAVGSDDNQLFADYIKYLKVAELQRNQILYKYDGKTDPASQDSMQIDLINLNGQVRGAQERLAALMPGSTASLLIRSSWEPQIPQFTGDTQEVKMQNYQYYKDHYFDEIDFADHRLIRTPFIHQKVFNYLERLVSPEPDSLMKEMDGLLAKMEGNEELYKYFVIQFLNWSARSEVVGYDAIYVHLVDQYYANGKADWLGEDQLNRILNTANTLRPLLIGKQAPDLEMHTQDNQILHLYDVESPYTVLFIWDPECGHCKKAMPMMEEFYQKYKDDGVKIFAICSKLRTQTEPEGDTKCWEFIDEHPEMKEWINVVDPYHQSRFKVVYDAKTTPQIYVMDKDKKSLSKKIGAEQLPGLFDFLLGKQIVPPAPVK